MFNIMVYIDFNLTSTSNHVMFIDHNIIILHS